MCSRSPAGILFIRQNVFKVAVGAPSQALVGRWRSRRSDVASSKVHMLHVDRSTAHAHLGPAAASRQSEVLVQEGPCSGLLWAAAPPSWVVIRGVEEANARAVRHPRTAECAQRRPTHATLPSRAQAALTRPQRAVSATCSFQLTCQRRLRHRRRADASLAQRSL